MKPQIIGISGSPRKNSNTDRLIKVEDQERVYDDAIRIGRLMGERLE